MASISFSLFTNCWILQKKLLPTTNWGKNFRLNCDFLLRKFWWTKFWSSNCLPILIQFYSSYVRHIKRKCFLKKSFSTNSAVCNVQIFLLLSSWGILFDQSVANNTAETANRLTSEHLLSNDKWKLQWITTCFSRGGGSLNRTQKCTIGLQITSLEVNIYHY